MFNTQQAEKLLEEATKKYDCEIPTPLIVALFSDACKTQDREILTRALEGIYVSGFVQGMLNTQKKMAVDALEKEVNKDAH